MRDKNKKNIILILLIIVLIILVIVLYNFYNLFNYNGITKVQKVLGEKYDNIKCIDIDCSGVIAQVNNDNYMKVKLYNKDGSIVANYKQKKTQPEIIPFSIGKGYFLSTTTDSKGNMIYFINDKSGKKLYNTKNKLKKLNDNFIIMSEEGRAGNIYTILDNKGNPKYKNINEYKVYSKEKYVYFQSNEEYYILDSRGNKILENYKIVDEVRDSNNKLLYLIVRDNNNINYYFDISNSKISLDGFNTYVINKDNTLNVTRKKNNKNINYKISSNGKKEKVIDGDTILDTINKVSKIIDNDKYYLYTLSILSSRQNKVLVDSKVDKTFGILDIESGNYEKLYEYNRDQYYSTISKLDSTNNHEYIQISCDSNACNSVKMIVFDVTKGTELFRLDGLSLVASNYVQYKNGYKVVKYSYKSQNENYKDKYVLYNNKNEELLVSDNQISIIDSENVIGKVNNESLLLYLSKDKKVLNDDRNLGEKIIISGKDYYKYNSGNKTIIIDKGGREIYSEKSSNLLGFSDNNIYSISRSTIKVYNIYNDEINTYKLLKNETMNDILDNKINPFEGAIFINNNIDKYIKIINSNGKLIKRINGVEIKTVTPNLNNKKAYIITRKNVNGKIKYGLYLAK